MVACRRFNIALLATAGTVVFPTSSCAHRLSPSTARQTSSNVDQVIITTFKDKYVLPYSIWFRYPRMSQYLKGLDFPPRGDRPSGANGCGGSTLFVNLSGLLPAAMMNGGAVAGRGAAELTASAVCKRCASGGDDGVPGTGICRR